jgi:hypothetical protein
MAKAAVELSNPPLDLAADSRWQVVDAGVFGGTSPEAALDHALNGLFDAARHAAEAAARRGDEIDAILAEIRAVRARAVC